VGVGGGGEDRLKGKVDSGNVVKHGGTREKETRGDGVGRRAGGEGMEGGGGGGIVARRMAEGGEGRRRKSGGEGGWGEEAGGKRAGGKQGTFSGVKRKFEKNETLPSSLPVSNT